MDDAEDDGYDIDEPDDERLRGNGIGIVGVGVGRGVLFAGHLLALLAAVCIARVSQICPLDENNV